jgi:beta-mannosidase
MAQIELNGAWQFRQSGETTWQEGQVPGTLLTDLLRLGEIEDPFYRNNEYKILPMFEADFEYQRSFKVDASFIHHDACFLKFEGLDTLAQVYLNDRLILESDNMFRTYEINVKVSLRAGENHIRVLFLSPLRYMRQKHEENPLFGIPMVVEGYTHLRKAHYMSGWDWGPKLPDCGVWRNISLVGVTGARWSDVVVRQSHQNDKVKLMLDLVVDSYGASKNRRAIIQVENPQGQRVQHSASIEASVTAEIDLDEPQIWWPHGYGEQPLYKILVQLVDENEVVLDERSYRVGLRTLTVNTDSDQWGEKFAFEVNGVQIFSMGADYIPEDNLLGRTSRERSERLIRDCVRANFNTIRVWGGGLYPDSYFYDLCDEYGILIWQDFMFACGVYDLSESLVQNSLHEIKDNVSRLRHHACLALFCGNNEIEMFFEDGRIEKTEENIREYISFFEERVPELVQQLAPDTFYWPGSPSGGGDFFESNGENYGDGHYWEVWHGNKPFTEYRTTYFRYMSEFGFESLPHIKTIEAFTKPDERNLFSYVMECHQKNPSGNQKILTYLSETFQYPKDLSSLVYVSQLMQAEAMRYGVEHWRRNRGRCMGALYWQLNDCWPTSSWASLDYYERWKALHYLAKRFYAQVLASACEEGTKVSFHVTNETRAQVTGMLIWSLRNMRSEVLAQGGVQTTVDALSSKMIDERDFASWLDTVEKQHNTYVEYSFVVEGEVVSQGSVQFVPAKFLQLAQPQIQLKLEETEDAFIVDVLSSAFAKFVELAFKDWDAVFSDNYFDLTGGETKRVVLLKSDLSVKATMAELEQQLTVRSLVDTY